MPITTTETVKTAIDTGIFNGDTLYTTITSILIAGLGAALWIRKKLSSDSLSIKKDEVEGDLLQHLEDERDHLKAEKDKILERLILVDAEKSAATAQVGKLTVEVEHLTRQVSNLEDMVERLGAKLDIATTAMQAATIENIKLLSRLESIQEIFALKCDNCVYKRECASKGIILPNSCDGH